MATIQQDYRFVFDDVQFGIDLRIARDKKRMTQREVGIEIGKESQAICNGLENARYFPSLLMCDFIALCKLFDLHPFDYFDMEKTGEPTRKD